MYLVGVPEIVTDVTNINNVTTGNVTSINTALAAFLGDTNQTNAGTPPYTSKMNVVHITSRAAPKPGQDVGSPLTGVGFAVTGLTVDSVLATQRRRLRG